MRRTYHKFVGAVTVFAVGLFVGHHIPQTHKPLILTYAPRVIVVGYLHANENELVTIDLSPQQRYQTFIIDLP